MTEDELGQDPKSPQDARLASLDERLARAQAEETVRSGGRDRDATAYYRSPAYRVLSVLIGYPIGCALIGYVIERAVGKHGIWVVALFVGFGVAIWEVWKISQQSPNGSGKE